MNKKIILLAVTFLFSVLYVQSADISKLPKLNSDGTISIGGASSSGKSINSSNNNGVGSNASSKSFELDKDTIYYPNANIKSAIAKYKSGNYSGCLQELFSLTKKDPSNSVAYYYMAMAYTHLDMKDEAVEAYEKVLTLHPNQYLAEYAIKGRDCLTDGPACKEEEQQVEESDELDQFIKSPYGNGLSPSLNNEVKQKQLNNFRQTINKKEQLENNDIQRIREFDHKNSKSSIEESDKVAQVSDEEILSAIKTLKDAGVNVTIGQENNPYAQLAQYQDPQMAELSMMLGGNNNNNNSMMNMVPLLMAQSQQGKNVDPRLMQAMLMNSMMSDMSFGNNNNNRY